MSVCFNYLTLRHHVINSDAAQPNTNRKDNPGWIADAIKHLRHSLPTSQLHDDLMNYKPSAGHFGISPSIEKMTDFLDAIKDLVK